jgi:serine/threonine-protein kinase HipA
MPPRSKFKGLVEVHLWGRQVGVAAWDDAGFAVFQYTKEFVAAGLPVSPLVMPLNVNPYQFRGLSRSEDFLGLPGMLADALPDKWGNLLIQRWLTDQGRDLRTVTPLERLCFVADRSMGALEFKPAIAPKAKHVRLHVDELLDLSQRILTAKAGRAARLSTKEKDALAQVILVGSSVGGNRAKALIAWDPNTDEIRAGDIPQPSNFEPWIIKFDETGSGEGAQPKGYGRIEHAYHLMAKAAGITMADCRLWEEHGRAHFMTKRFDRVGTSAKKVHYQSLSPWPT